MSASPSPSPPRQILGEVDGWFSEGLDTADLRAATGLLETLEGGVPAAIRPMRA